MVNKPFIRPYFWGGVALGGVARIPLKQQKVVKITQLTLTPLVFHRHLMFCIMYGSIFMFDTSNSWPLDALGIWKKNNTT